jgi:hypothetical protein
VTLLDLHPDAETKPDMPKSDRTGLNEIVIFRLEETETWTILSN